MDRAEMELLYRQLLSMVVLLARLLGKPCPIVTRAERRRPIDERADLMVK
jgi:hypothetical protein